MSNKKSIYPQVDSKYEFLVFLEYVEKATGWARGKAPYLDSFYSKKGIAGITNEPIYIYFESYSEIRWHHEKYSKTKRAFIRLGKEHLKHDNLIDESIDYADNIILGPRFFLSLAKKNPELWWLFVASCSEKPRVVVDKDGKTLILTAEKMPCIFNLINITPTLDRKRINALSNIFKEDFIYQRKHSRETYIVLGNGVSIPFGSDLWNQLSDYLFDFLTPQYIENGPLVKKRLETAHFLLPPFLKQLLTQINTMMQFGHVFIENMKNQCI